MYSKNVYEKADSIILGRKQKAEQDFEDRHSKCLALYPEIGALEKEMASAAMQAAKAIGMGDRAGLYIQRLAEENLNCQSKIKEILKRAGFGEDYLEIKYYCSMCRDSGLKDGKYCDCYKKILRTVAFEKMCDQYPLEKSTFERFDLAYYPEQYDETVDGSARDHMKQVKAYCKNYAEDFSLKSPNLLLYGSTGLGKTHLSLAIAGKVIEEGYGVIYGSAQNLLNALEREKFNKSVSNETGSSEKLLLDCDLLIIDDLGAEFSTQFTVSALYNIINSRLMSARPVIISTNLTPDELEERYTQRITSRLIGNYFYITFCGRDIRQLKAE